MKSPYSSWIGTLDGSRLVRTVSRILSFRAVADALLGAVALERRTPKRKLRYRVADWNGWLAHHEWQDPAKIARLTSASRPVSTFIDLGANSGFFSLALLESLGEPPLRALLIEANGRLIRGLERLSETNGLPQIRIVHGAVGTGLEPGTRVPFAVEPAHLGSHLGALPSSTEGAIPTRRIEVPAVSVLAEWTALAGDLPVDFLKIDVEGAEYGFLASEPELLERTRRILVEWHHRVAPREAGEALLDKAGFHREELIFDRPEVSQGFYVKR